MSTQPIRVFPDRNKWTPDDELAFVGDLPLEPFRPGTPETPVMVSVTFTWWRLTAEQFWHSDSSKYMGMGRFEFAEAFRDKSEAAEIVTSVCEKCEELPAVFCRACGDVEHKE